jgi:guanylate kinase
MDQGKAVIFSAPSGSGKTTIVQHLLRSNPKLGFSISACTRDPRGTNEKHGKDYYFLSVEEFKQKIKNNQFVEWEEVYPGNFYGTLKNEVQRLWDEGKAVIFDVDVKGGLKLKDYFGDQALAVFIRVPSLNDLEERLKLRHTETEESLLKRLDKARYEMGFEDKFDVSIINDELNSACKEAEELVNDFIQ